MNIYNVFPLLAGPFPDWRPHLRRAAEMGFDWIYVNPIQRPGRSGSIYSISDYFQINPLLLDPRDPRPGDEQARDLLRAAKDLGLRVMADLVVNHCAYDSPLTRAHPEWFVAKPNGQVAHPYCEDHGNIVVWTDLAKFAHTQAAYDSGLYAFALGVAEHLLALGFEGFRCDAAYQVPGSFWTRLCSDVRRRRPECVFVGETLGCTVSEARRTASAGFDLIYNSAKWWDFESSWLLQQHDLLRGAASTLSFPEDHDTPRLFEESGGAESCVKQRCLFTAFFSKAWLVPMGFEFGFRKRLHVSRTRPVDWEIPGVDLQPFIRRILDARRRHGVLSEDGPIRVLPASNPRILVLWKGSQSADVEALLVLNKDCARSQHFEAPHLGDYLQISDRLEDVSPELGLGAVPVGHFSRELGAGQGLLLVGRPRGDSIAREIGAPRPPSSAPPPSSSEGRSDTLCVLPWIHSFIATTGHVSVCCVSGTGQELPPAVGTVGAGPLQDIFLGERMNVLRERMLAGEWPPECTYCRLKEARGVRSSRQVHNELHEPYFRALLERRGQMRPRLRSLDVRPDNLCNFKCRTCSGFASTRWVAEHDAMYSERSLGAATIGIDRSSECWREIERLLRSDVERVHFAGGEPLISPRHYALLDLLIDAGRFGVELYYDTNLSRLELRGRDVVRLWDLFPSVTVSMSLDGVGLQGEHIRRGLRYETWCRSVERLREEVPHVKRKLHFVVSALNVMSLGHHLMTIIERELVDASMIRLTFLEWPSYLNVQILPAHMKAQCEERLQVLIGRVKQMSSELASQLEGLIRYLGERDLHATHLAAFATKTRQLDRLRGESTEALFPELKELLSED